jgi:hypothetical protein
MSLSLWSIFCTGSTLALALALVAYLEHHELC